MLTGQPSCVFVLQGEAAVHFRHMLLCLQPAADHVSWELLVKSALAAYHPRVQPEAKPRFWRAVMRQSSATISTTLAGALGLT